MSNHLLSLSLSLSHGNAVATFDEVVAASRVQFETVGFVAVLNFTNLEAPIKTIPINQISI